MKTGASAKIVSSALLVVAGALVLLCFFVPWRAIHQRWVFSLRFERVGTNPQGLAEYRHRETGIVFVRVPGASFIMGSGDRQLEDVIRCIVPLEMLYYQQSRPLGQSREGRRTAGEWAAWVKEQARARQAPHRVTLDPFLIAKYELSQQVWEGVMGWNPAGVKAADRPVNGVSWHDCQAFCARSGLRMPSEAQWEYAALAGSEDVSWYGCCLPGFSPSMSPDEFWKAWLSTIHTGGPAEKDPFGPNGFGLYNTLGNVSELCEDYYEDGFFHSVEAGARNPVCVRPADRAVSRGGCQSSTPLWLLPRNRSSSETDSRLLNDGFRPAYYPMP